MEINQIYRAPSLPKISRRNINSSLNRGALGSGISLKKSSFSFKQLTPKITPSKLVSEKSENQESRGIVKYIQSNLNIFKVLEESNKLLSQIREQLSLDYDERIKERNENLRLSKKRIAKNKINEKEKRIESRGKSLIGSALNTVIAPAKSIFQRILDFLSVIITGIVLNTAFKWLSKKENQEKLEQFFNFLKDYWKELLVVFGAIKLFGLVRKLYKIGRGLRSLFKNRLKTPRVQPPKFPLEDLCAKLPNCIKEPSPELTSALQAQMQAAISKTDYKPIFTGIFNGLLGLGAIEILKQLIGGSDQIFQLIENSESSPTLQPEVIQASTGGTETSSSESSPLKSFTGKKIPSSLAPILKELQAEYARTKKPASRLTDQGMLIVRATAPNRAGFLGGPDMTPQISFNPNLTIKSNQQAVQQATALFTIANLPATLAPVAAGKGVIGRSTNLATKRGSLGAYRPPSVQNFAGSKPTSTPKADKILQPATSNIVKKTNPIKITASTMQEAAATSMVKPTSTSSKLSKIGRKKSKRVDYDEAYEKGVRAEYDRLLLESGNPKEAQTQFLRTFKQSDLDKILEANKLSKGGTVFGSGSQTVDSVPAMLAPGEEVIRSSAANLFRPLLKDINDNAGRLWKQFTEATINQEKINAVTRRSNRVFKDLITEFTELFDEEKREISKKKRKERAKTNPPSGGGSPGLKSKITRPKRSSPKKMSGPSIPAPKFVSQNKQSPSRSHFSSVNNSIRQPVTNNIAKPVTNVQNIVQSPTSTTVVPFVIEKETGSPSVNVVNLAPKVLDLSKKSTPKPRTTQSDATSPIPSISPFDSNNDFNYTVPETLGILV